VLTACLLSLTLYPGSRWRKLSELRVNELLLAIMAMEHNEKQDELAERRNSHLV
jgi:hypothetical protein